MRKNKILYFTILSIISFLVCRCTLQEKKNSYEDTPMVDFDRGSAFYQLDIKEDRLNTKENILLTREIVVEDSIFGGKENRDNWNRAFA